MIFLGYFLSYIIRYNLSVHVVDMAHISKGEYTKYNFTIALKSGHPHTRSRSGVSFNIIVIIEFRLYSIQKILVILTASFTLAARFSQLGRLENGEAICCISHRILCVLSPISQFRGQVRSFHIIRLFFFYFTFSFLSVFLDFLMIDRFLKLLVTYLLSLIFFTLHWNTRQKSPSSTRCHFITKCTSYLSKKTY